MSQPKKQPADFRNILLSLDSRKIANRLAELHGEEDALKVLYKAAQARERASRNRHSSKQNGGAQ